MHKCLAFWKEKRIWSAINDQKPICVEPKTKPEFVAAMKNYNWEIAQPNSKGAIFMAVLRGKVSEGLDFADMYGRAVVITGLPFAPCEDPKVKLKQTYLNENRNGNGMLTGFEWYVLDAIRAVNQAIGRVIRHKNDYGAILLCDTRFRYPKNTANISKWIQNHLNPSKENFKSMTGQLTRFFENAEQTVWNILNLLSFETN